MGYIAPLASAAMVGFAAFAVGYGVGKTRGNVATEIWAMGSKSYRELDAGSHHIINAKGTWRGEDLAGKANFSEVHCDLANGVCTDSQASIMQLNGENFLDESISDYAIATVTDKLLVANQIEPPECAVETLIIDRAARSVSVSRVRRSGADPKFCGTAPDAHTYVLGEPWRGK